MIHLRVRLTAMALGCALAILLSVGSGLAHATPPLSAVYLGAADPSGVLAFEAWRGVPLNGASDYFGQSDWSDIASPTWWLQRWESGAPRLQMIYGVPMLPNAGGTLADGAAGNYDQYFRSLAENLVAYGQGNSILRLGWEFNGNYDPWFAGTNSEGPQQFAAYWRNIVTTMRSVPGAAFQFDWNPNLGAEAFPAEEAWPGNAYVDFVGVDVYDQAWGNYGAPITDPAARWQWILTQDHGLDFWASFAASHGKPLTIPEWGLAGGSNGGGDDPFFITAMEQWMSSHNIALESYFDYGAGQLGSNPVAAATYLNQVNVRSPAPSPPAPAPAPSTGTQPASPQPTPIAPTDSGTGSQASGSTPSSPEAHPAGSSGHSGPTRGLLKQTLSLTTSKAPRRVSVRHVTWLTLRLSSLSQRPARNVVLTDTLPQQLKVSRTPRRCRLVARTLACALGSIAVHATRVLHVAVRPIHSGTLVQKIRASTETNGVRAQRLAAHLALPLFCVQAPRRKRHGPPRVRARRSVPSQRRKPSPQR